MDFVNKFTGGDNDKDSSNSNAAPGSTTEQQAGNSGNNSSGGFFGGLGNKLNGAAGGGRDSEKNEDMLDKGIDFVQEKFMGQGAQDNESAVEQAKDEQISDYIRGQYKSMTGSNMPIKDKATALDRDTD